jgi:hypothetical protein
MLVLRLRDERDTPAGIERNVLYVARAERHARNGDDADPLVLPAYGLAGGGVAQKEAALAGLEPQAKPLAQSTLSASPS